MIKNETYKKIIKKNSYLSIIKDIGIENMELSKETILYYEPKLNRFSYQEFQFQWLKLIINEVKNGTNARLKYIHKYPENEIYTSVKEEYETEILNIIDFQNIMQKLGFIVAYTDKKKKVQSQVLEKYILTLYNTNDSYYEIEMKTIDLTDITKKEFEEINLFFEKYGIIPDENF